MTAHRNDHQWLEDLNSSASQRRSDAIADLRDLLLRGLTKTLAHHPRVDRAFVEDVVQEASLKILSNLDSFQGRSKFRTWAITIAVRTAVSQMRKRQWQDVSLESLTAAAVLDPSLTIDQSETADQTANRAALLRALKAVIDAQLTNKQWTAITAELAGMPLAEIAEKMDTSPNSLYKLLHDARKKLRRGLEAEGFTIDDVRSALA